MLQTEQGQLFPPLLSTCSELTNWHARCFPIILLFHTYMERDLPCQAVLAVGSEVLLKESETNSVQAASCAG